MDPVLRDDLIRLVFDVLALLITTLVPVLLAWAIGSIRDARIRAQAETLVRFAQMQIPNTSDRYAYAAAHLARRFPALSEERVREAVEAAVHAIKYAPLPPPEPAPAVRVFDRPRAPEPIRQPADLDLSDLDRPRD